MIRFTAPKVLEAALWIQLCDKRALDIDLFPGGVRFHLPSQHLLSLYCSVPPGEILSILSDMEKSGLIIKEERRGLWTASRGNILVAEIIETRFKKEARALLGQKILRSLLKRFRASLPDQETARQGKNDDNRSSPEYKERFVSKDTRALKRHTCKSCRSTFFTNDARRKKCDQCLQAARFKLIRSQKKR